MFTKVYRLGILILFVIFALLHFYKLSGQEFVGDEASPILLIDKAWDVFKSRDLKYLAFPFIWYHEPFRAVFSGTLIHITGVDKIWLRLPGIIFSLASFWFLVWIFIQEKIPKWLTFLSMAIYVSSATFMDYRLASGDSQANFLILLTAYLIYSSLKNKSWHKLVLALWVFLLGFLTMLDTTVLILPLSLAVYMTKAWERKIFVKTLKLVLAVIVVYLSLWLLLPYLAFRFEFQPWYQNRGLFYYFSRVGEGVAVDPFLGFKALVHYSSWALLIWVVISMIFSWFNKGLRLIQWIVAPALIAILMLNRSSSHILVYFGIFFLQAVMFSDWVYRKSIFGKVLVSLGLLLIVYFNFHQLYFHFFKNPVNTNDLFVNGHPDVFRPGVDIDEAVKVLYRRYP